MKAGVVLRTEIGTSEKGHGKSICGDDILLSRCSQQT